MERPEQLAGAHVERAHESLGVVVRADGRALAERGADDDDVLRDGGRRVPADFSGLEIDLLPGAEDDALLQIDDAVLAEAGNRRAVVGIERDQPVAGGHVDHAIVAAAVGPI
jgi:hypothetical protein